MCQFSAKQQQMERAYFVTSSLTSCGASYISYLADLHNETVLLPPSSCWGTVAKRKKVARVVGHFGSASEVLLGHFTILPRN